MTTGVTHNSILKFIFLLCYRVNILYLENQVLLYLNQRVEELLYNLFMDVTALPNQLEPFQLIQKHPINSNHLKRYINLP